MEFSIDVEELQQIIKSLGVVAKRNTNEPSGRILIEAENDKIRFVANNDSVAIGCVSSKNEIKKEGSASVVYNKLRSFIQPFEPYNGEFGLKKVIFKTTDKAVNITSENIFENGSTSKAKLRLDLFNTYAIQQPKILNNTTFILNSNMMKAAIDKISYAINPNEVRAFIQGMCVEFDDKNIYFAGTNGLMLTQYRMENNSNLKKGKYSIKYDFVSALLRLLQSDGTQLFVEIENDRIKIKFNNIYMEGRMIIGHEYPNYHSTLDSFSNVITLNKDVLMGILIPFHDILDQDDHYRLTISTKDGNMEIYNDNLHFHYKGDIGFNDEFIIDVNGRFVHQTLMSIKDDKLLMKFSDDSGVLIFDSANYEDQKSLITPIKRR
jgi:DNA polymerase III sliding clamp (beta) subunit (PCNA family)